VAGEVGCLRGWLCDRCPDSIVLRQSVRWVCSPIGRGSTTVGLRCSAKPL